MYKSVLDLLRHEEEACLRCLYNYDRMATGTKFIKPAEVDAYLADIRQAMEILEDSKKA